MFVLIKRAFWHLFWTYYQKIELPIFEEFSNIVRTNSNKLVKWEQFKDFILSNANDEEKKKFGLSDPNLLENFYDPIFLSLMKIRLYNDVDIGINAFLRNFIEYLK